MKIPAVELVRFIDSILMAYPENIFVPPSQEEWRQCDETLKAAGLSLSA